jgi:hypothetical protein
VPRDRNRAYISHRDACKELSNGRRKIREWFAELEHYGFIALALPGSLGVDGEGKAPHWRLTELGNTSKASADGLFEAPGRDYLRWDGVLFDPTPFRYSRKREYEKQNPGIAVDTTLVSPSTPPLESASTPPQPESGVHGGAIEGELSGVRGGAISRLTTIGKSPPLFPASSEGSLEDKNHGGVFDERVIQLDETTNRLRAERRKARRAS